jgi:phosphatidylglycerol lysyltransferase
MVYGLLVILNTLGRQLRIHHLRDIDGLFLTVPVFIGMSYIYLGTLLLRRKYTAWLVMIVLLAFTLLFDLSALATHAHFRLFTDYGLDAVLRLVVTASITVLLLTARPVFRARSDMVGFRRAVVVSSIVLAVTFLYGMVGFTLLDQRDFHREINLVAAAHETVDQFGLTNPTVVAYSARARWFIDSLSIISCSAALYVALAFFQPIRFRLRDERSQRRQVEKLLRAYPSDIDDFFKLWPHDKHYFFDVSQEAGVAYRVVDGVALVVGDPFGNPKRFLELYRAFQEFCFVNDWRPAAIHIGDVHRDLYEKLGMQLQKIGEEAILDLEAYQEYANDKYFRQIKNRFTKLNHSVQLVEAPHGQKLLDDLACVSAEWLGRPGRAERGFMMGYSSNEYMQRSMVAVLYDEHHSIQGFMNIVPTYQDGTANYDMLRCAGGAPGNSNDFLLMSAITLLRERAIHTLNLGLCPLKGLDEKQQTTSLIDKALGFIYANGDRFYSFRGLERFKDKYHPAWEARYVAYSGNLGSFTRVMRALTKAMKVK